GLLVEIQSGPLGPLRAKLGRLLPEHRVRVVKPVVLERRVVRRARTDGPDLSARRSPKRGAVVDLFEDLVGLARILPDPNLDIEVLPVSIDEIRVCAAGGQDTGSSIAAWSRSWGNSVSSVPLTSGNCYHKAMTGSSHSPRPTSPAGSIVRCG